MMKNNLSSSRNHKDLVLWQKARRLTVAVYQTTATFPAIEQFGLVSQSRRACISVVSNISEGAARGSDKEFRQFLYVARGSLAELEAQLLVASDLGYLPADDPLHAHIAEIGRMINGLIAATHNGMSFPANT